MRPRASIVSALLLILAPLDLAAQPAGKRLTIEAIFDQGLSAPEPSQVRWISDQRLAYFLEAEAEESQGGEGEEADGEGEKKGGQDLWVMDASTGEREIVVAADELREIVPKPDLDERERTRRSRFRVPPFHFSPAGDSILFTTTGQLVLHRPEAGETTVLAPSRHGVLDPKFSPDGETVAFIYEHDLWRVPAAAGGEEQRLTRGGHQLLLHGGVSWVYAEEFGVQTGYHFSPDGRHIAFLEMDESPVPTYPITEQLAWQAKVDLQRYPKPGDPNPKVRVGIVNVETGRTAWLDRAAEYVPRIGWAGDENLAVQLMNRGQDELELVLADPATGRSRSVFFERDEHWLDVTDDLTFLADGEHFLWTSQRSGLRHIYRYHRSGKLVGQLTAGDFRVGAIAGVDEEGGWVYYTANAANLLGQDLYRVRLDASRWERMTTEKGTHAIQMNPSATAWVDSFSALDVRQVRRQTVRDLASGGSTELYRDRDLSEHGLVRPELLELETGDGAMVRVMLIKPPKLERGRKHPMLVYVYGMAGVPTIRDARRGSGKRFLFHQFLAQQGYVVAYVDDRSSSVPGHKHAVLADHDVGPLMARDIGVAVEHFRSLPYVDPDRLAVWGWSGGGFSTCFLLGHTDFFKVGIAGAPVTDWRLYDSIYTERYMGLPEDDPEAYDRTSTLKGAADVRGRLLLIHGTHDDNVHPQNTLKMVDELVKSRKQFDLMMYPNKTHGITGADHNVHLYTMIWEYLERHL